MQIILLWMFIIVTVFAVIFVYAIGSNLLVDKFIPNANDTVNSMDLNTTSPEVPQIIGNIQTSWIYAVAIIVFGLFLVGIIGSTRTEYESGDVSYG